MKTKKKKVIKIMENIIIIILLCVFCYATYNLYLIYKANWDENQEIESIRDIAKLPEEYDKDFRIDINELKKVNEDVVAWIEIEGTNISYPVVQGKDNSYYLDRTFEKKENYVGSIFMDYTASNDFSDENTFIYGHNVKHGTMFAQLEEYMKSDFYNSHQYITIYKEDKTLRYQIFSAYEAEGNSDSFRMDYNDEHQYQEYLEMIKSKSLYDTNVVVNNKDKIITLYTCSYDRNSFNFDEEVTMRYYIHAKLVS